ncbi:hypothetical protein C7H19_10080 [Aphanothece hegewaldii CCALA 016]|uniref:Uncharacterized protein n=1 Tax=Aphanothece hegewaldii CCALA 016 TaxID=2107694 RepID=A0A2T1LYP2_9CHRO|nr:serine protease [Aphanothece hegewaldii]PSF37506.1 hypothetical protein C7H19_10080 [Aphanothece hegewaldii CCALA 016]
MKARRSTKKSSSWVRKLLIVVPLLIALPFGSIYGLFTVYRIQGEQFSAKGERQKAIAAYQSALHFNFNSATTYLKLAQVQQQEGLFFDALASYQQAFQINPNLESNSDAAVALKELGDTFIKKFSYEEATFAYEKSIQLEPFYLEAYLGLGNYYLKQKLWEKARKNYEKVISIDSEHLESYIALGTIYRQQKELQQAEEMYKKALALKPYDPKISQYLGQTYQELGLTQQAIEYYLQAITIEPKNGELYNLLGEALYKQKEIGQANEAYEKALQYAPKNAKIYQNLCLSQLNLKQYELALKRCQQAYRLNPELVEARVYAIELERGLAVRNNPNVLNMPEQLPSTRIDPLVQTKRSIVKIFALGDSFNSIGTGWIVKRENNKAWIVTNRHVVIDSEKTLKQASRIAVEFYSTPEKGQIRRRQNAKIIKVAPQEDWIDLAVLEVDNLPNDIKPFTLASTVGITDLPVKVIGNPITTGDWVLAKGTVLQVNEQQVMMAIKLASGFSGGPVLTPSNQVVGLVSQAGLYCPNSPPPDIIESSLQLGCGIAVPIEAVKERLQSWGILK